MDTPDSTTLKRCTKCGEWKPATTEYYSRRLDRLRAACRVCDAKTRKAWTDANPERQKARKKDYRAQHLMETAEYQRAWRKTHPEYWKGYYEANKAHRSQIGRLWRNDNREKTRVKANRRRARELLLPNSYDSSDWQTALEHFDHSCAVCGQGLLVLSHQDHWIPLSSADCPGTVPHNMVPLCSTCNVSKGGRNPAEWLTGRFGKRKGLAILKRIEAFLAERKPEGIRD